jgi:transposase
MPKIKYRYDLTEEEKEQLESLTTKGRHSARKVVNALILINCDDGNERRLLDKQVAQTLRVSMTRVHRVKQRFVEDGLDAALEGSKSQRVYEKKADGEVEAHLVAMSCGDPPEGYARWSLRLLADQAVELGYVEEISHETVRRVLKKTSSSPGRR